MNLFKAFGGKRGLWMAAVAAGCASMFAQTPPLQHSSSGRVERMRIFSPQMRDTVTVDVWLPQAYLDSPTLKLPVVYMHDGQNLFDASTTWNGQSWEMDSVITSLADRDLITPPLVVGVHSVAETRVADLMPEAPFKGTSILEDLNKPGLVRSPLRGDAYAAFVAKDLRDSINHRYRVLTDPAHTAVMGSSMGGLMSAYMLCEYPEVYGGAGCLSTHWVGDVSAYEGGKEEFPKAMYDYLERKLPRDGSHRIYFDRGTATIDAYYDKWDDRVIALAESLGYTRPDRLQTYVAPGAPHEENAWKARVHLPLLFLFPKQ